MFSPNRIVPTGGRCRPRGPTALGSVLRVTFALVAAWPARIASAEHPGWYAELARTLSGLTDDSPHLRGADAEVDAARFRAEAAGRLPDPMVSLAVANWSPGRSPQTEPMTQVPLLGARQVIPAGFERRAERRLADTQVAAVASQFREVHEMHALHLARLAFEFAAAAESLRATDAALTELRTLAKNSTARFQAGVGLRVASNRLAMRIAGLEAMAAEDRARLERVAAEWAGVVPGSRPPSLDGFGLADDWSPVSSASDAVATSPAVLAAEAMAATARARVNLARAGLRPEFTIGVNYGVRQDRPDMVGGELGMSLPLWATRSQRLERFAAERNAAAADEHRHATVEQIEAQVTGRIADWQAAREKERLLRDVVAPLAGANLDSLRAAYRAGGTDLDAVVDAELDRREATLDWLAAVARRRVAEAEILALSGRLGNLHTREHE